MSDGYNRVIYTTLNMQDEVIDNIDIAIGTSSVISYDFEEVMKDHFVNDLERLEEFRIKNLMCLNSINILKREFQYYDRVICNLLIELKR